MTPLPNKNYCIPNKSDLNIANSLSTVLSVPEQIRFLILHVPKFMSISHCLCRSKIYSEVLCCLLCSWTCYVFRARNFCSLSQPWSCSTTLWQTSTTAYSVHWHLPSISESPPSTTWGHFMPWWQVPSNHEQMNTNTVNCSECGHVAVVKHWWNWITCSP